ncbi:MAG: DUF6446 family protein [Paracoccaceae bacterium]|nr:DUF6446 family protein [Paracoccaceae bacterium]
MTGKILAACIVLVSLIAGVSIYYLQVYAYYTSVVVHGTEDVRVTSQLSGQPEAIAYTNFEAIDSYSSPIRYRACFKTSSPQDTLRQTYQVLERAEPRVAPGWFGCFDAAHIGAALESGAAVAFMGHENISYGIDRIVAIDSDGTGYVWHQINRCGKFVFHGRRAPSDCLTPPEGT